MKRFSSELERIEGIAVSFDRDGDSVSVCAEQLPQFTASLCREECGFAFSFGKTGGIEVDASRLSGMGCSFEYTDKADINEKYLEIEPTVLWVFPDLESMNDVYSNVTWRIN